MFSSWLSVQYLRVKLIRFVYNTIIGQYLFLSFIDFSSCLLTVIPLMHKRRNRCQFIKNKALWISRQLKILYGISRPIVLIYMANGTLGMITIPYIIVEVSSVDLYIGFQCIFFNYTTAIIFYLLFQKWTSLELRSERIFFFKFRRRCFCLDIVLYDYHDLYVLH